jgi:hypothetical protein
MGSPPSRWPTAILSVCLPAVVLLAKETAAEFAKVQESSTSLYPAMIKNLQTTQRRFAELRAEAAKNKEMSFINWVHLLTWEEITADLKKAEEEESQRFEVVKNEVEKFFKELGETKPQVQNAEEALKKAKSLLESAIQNENLWMARDEFFRRTIAFICQKVAAQDQKLDVPATTIEFKEKVLDKKDVKEKYLKDGEVATRDNSLTEILKISDISEQTNWRDLLQRFIPRFDPGTAPGISVVMLSLARDLAQAELDKARLKVSYLNGMVAALQEDITTAYIKAALSNIKDAEESLLPRETVFDTLTRLRGQTERDLTIRPCLFALAYYAVVQNLDEATILEWETRPAILSSEYSIRLAAINAREREALIARGLQGLNTYFEGGLKPETIGNFLRAAQAVALAFVAAGVF